MPDRGLFQMPCRAPVTSSRTHLVSQNPWPDPGFCCERGRRECDAGIAAESGRHWRLETTKSDPKGEHGPSLEKKYAAGVLAPTEHKIGVRELIPAQN